LYKSNKRSVRNSSNKMVIYDQWLYMTMLGILRGKEGGV
jgi:hypothetical protein